LDLSCSHSGLSVLPVKSEYAKLGNWESGALAATPSPVAQPRFTGDGTPAAPLTAVYSTRFQGSKRRFMPWLLTSLTEYLSGSARILDAFAGSGVVSYGLSCMGHRVFACDRLTSAIVTVHALCGESEPLTSDIIRQFGRLSETDSNGWLVKEFSGIHYHDHELHWLENATDLAHELPAKQQAVALWAICQAALAKRPYNLFHRSNLAMRTRDVPRTFGNKATWERSFAIHFSKFASECERFMLQYSNLRTHAGDPRSVSTDTFDLVYMDPPYIGTPRVPTPYNDYYSFLDYICLPETRSSIDRSKPHKPRRWKRSEWEDPLRLSCAMGELVDRHPSSTIAISYRSDGFPQPRAIVELLRSKGRTVHTYDAPAKYALSKSQQTRECLIVGY
jgi:adenine-specific DNA-methyltransferase